MSLLPKACTALLMSTVYSTYLELSDIVQRNEVALSTADHFVFFDRVGCGAVDGLAAATGGERVCELSADALPGGGCGEHMCGQGIVLVDGTYNR